MTEMQEAGGIPRRTFMQTAGAGALAAGLGMPGHPVEGAESLLRQSHIDPQDARMHPMLEEV